MLCACFSFFFGEIESDKTILCIDTNKCRNNILYHGKYDYCVFTVFDKLEVFVECTTIVPGLYYVESDNYMPLRWERFYYHYMICYLLENNIVTLCDIKFVIHHH